MSMDFGRARGLGAGRKYEGRPIVWEAREVREEASHGRFASLDLLSLLPTKIEKTLGIPPSYTLCTGQRGIWLTLCVHTMTTRQKPAPPNLTPHAPPPPPSLVTASRSWFLQCLDALHVTATSLACKSEPQLAFTVFRCPLHHHHLPRMQPYAKGLKPMDRVGRAAVGAKELATSDYHMIAGHFR
jgi:hypothetical protein